jgi:hypothetical protein
MNQFYPLDAAGMSLIFKIFVFGLVGVALSQEVRGGGYSTV